ncbi:MAG: DMT family transporter [Acidimicrobiia bacterium]
MTESLNGRSLITTSAGVHAGAFGLGEWTLLAVVAGVWGSSFLFIAIGLDAFEPGLVTLLRIALGAATLGLFPRARRPIDRADRPRVVLLGIVWIVAPLLLFPIAQQWIDSSLAGMINGSMPLFAALIASVLLRRIPGRRQAAGLLVGFAGVVAIGWPAARGASATALGAGLVLLAQVFYGLSANLAVPLQQRYGSLPVLFRAQLVALVIVLPIGLASVPGSEFAWPSALAVTALGVFGTGLAFVAMTALVGRVGATRGSVAIYFLPVVAIALGVAFRDETVAALSLGGVALVIVGAYLASRREDTGQPSDSPAQTEKQALPSVDASSTHPAWPTS